MAIADYNADEHERSSLLVAILDGPDSYDEWFRGITNVLLITNLSEVADGTHLVSQLDAETTANAGDPRLLRTRRKQDRKAYGLINSSVSTTVIRSVPAHLAFYDASAEKANSYLLLEHLKATYSSRTSPRQAELWSTVFRSDLEEGSDPTPFMARLKDAFDNILATGTDIPDHVLSYAILGALPPSYSVVAQTIYMDEKPPSTTVLAAIRTEWRRRKVSTQR